MKPLLILDLDETLISSIDVDILRVPDDYFLGYYIYWRPNLEEFFTTVTTYYEVAIWSSAAEDYVKHISSNLPCPQPFIFVWGESRNTYCRDFDLNEWFFLKDLRKVRRKGFSLEKVLIVDDEPRKLKRSYGNAIYIKPYTRDPDDRELEKLAKYLVSISSVKNFRRIEKRDWSRLTV